MGYISGSYWDNAKENGNYYITIGYILRLQSIIFQEGPYDVIINPIHFLGCLREVMLVATCSFSGYLDPPSTPYVA